MELIHAGRGEPGGELVLVEARYVRGGELLQLQPAKSGFDLHADGYLVAVEGALPDGAGEPLEPRIQVLSDANVLIVEDQPLAAVAQCLREPVSNGLALLALLSVDRFRFGPAGVSNP